MTQWPDGDNWRQTLSHVTSGKQKKTFHPGQVFFNSQNGEHLSISLSFFSFSPLAFILRREATQTLQHTQSPALSVWRKGGLEHIFFTDRAGDLCVCAVLSFQTK